MFLLTFVDSQNLLKTIAIHYLAVRYSRKLNIFAVHPLFCDVVI